MQVVYQISGDIPDRGFKTSVLCDEPLTMKKIQRLFPFEGTFHFRVKVPGWRVGSTEIEYVWLDVVDLESEMAIENNLCEVRALPIDIPVFESSDDDEKEYIEEITRYIPQNRQPAATARVPQESAAASSSARHYKRQEEDETVVGINITALKSAALKTTSTLQSGATSIWNKMKATAAQLQNQATSAVAEAAVAKQANDMLTLLAKDVATVFSDDNQYHVQLLQSLWELHFPGQPFSRTSITWKIAGWQKDDPVTDLKNSGLLALHCLIYQANTYPEQTQRMIQANQANKKNNYPFAIVAVNITLLLADLFKLRDPQLNASKENFGALFAEMNAFNEVFCVAFSHIDITWTERNAVRTDFGKIIGEFGPFPSYVVYSHQIDMPHDTGECKIALTKVIERGPTSVHDFKLFAAEEGLRVE